MASNAKTTKADPAPKKEATATAAPAAPRSVRGAAIASLGVDRISLGSLTHSVQAADLALELRPV